MEKSLAQGDAFGDRIPGSRLYRCFCHRCGEPMRSTWAALHDEHYCEAARMSGRDQRRQSPTSR